MAVTADPIGSGFVASLARPGGNITGLTSLSPDISGKRLELLKEIVPSLSRVGVLWNKGNPDNAKQLREAESAANTLRLEIYHVEVRNADDFDKAFPAIVSARVGALYALGDNLFATNRKRIVGFTAKNKLALMLTTRQGAEAGALVAYGTNFLTYFGGPRPSSTRSSREPSLPIFPSSSPRSSSWSSTSRPPRCSVSRSRRRCCCEPTK
jgi:ABC-type uncharacterized transport system substrate-binding protein